MIGNVLIALFLIGVLTVPILLIFCDIRENNQIMEKYYSDHPKKKWNKFDRHIYTEEFRDKHTIKEEGK